MVRFTRKRRARAKITGNTSNRRTNSKRRPFRRTFKKRSFKRRTFKRKSRRAGLAKITSRVAKLAKTVSGTTSTLIHRTFLVQRIDVGQGASAFNQMILSSFVRTENAISQVPFFDAATNTVISVQPTANAFQQGFNFETTSSRIVVTNNSTVGCTVRLGVMEPKEDTSQGPTAAFSSGLSDIGLSITDPMVRMSDSNVLMGIWKWVPKTYKEVVLAPGAKYELTVTSAPYTYQLATQDADNQAYPKSIRSQVLVIQALGTVQHDATNAGFLNFGQCALDVSALTTRRITYAGGANMTRVAFHDTARTTMAAGGTEAQKPIAELQQFT